MDTPFRARIVQQRVLIGKFAWSLIHHVRRSGTVGYLFYSGIRGRVAAHRTSSQLCRLQERKFKEYLEKIMNTKKKIEVFSAGLFNVQETELVKEDSRFFA